MLHLFCPAKLNLFLHITGVRADGYHTLESVFCAVDFGDDLRLELVDAPALVTLLGADTLTDDPNDNLITRAIHTLAKLHPHLAHPVRASLTKRLPAGAGLGGGSSNCASTLIGINALWGLGLDCQALMQIGVGLGADVPFFVHHHYHGPAALVTGIGEYVQSIALPDCHYLIITPDAHISTAALFASPQLHSNCASITDHFTDHHTASELWAGGDLVNVFEPIVCLRAPAVKTAIDYLRTLEAHTGTKARLTGTGAAAFLPIVKLPSKNTLDIWMAHAPYPAYLARAHHPVHDATLTFPQKN